MLLAIDVGNSRIKWAGWHEESWGHHGVSATTADLAELATLAQQADHVIGCCVASDAIRTQIENCCGDVTWIDAATPGTIVNHYQPPTSLGADRWCALHGMQQHVGHGVVVLAGTAVTVDQLREDGSFAGGLILPGRQLMHQALAEHTQLNPVASTNEDAAELTPGDTAAAIRSGSLLAIAGAIKLQCQLWQAEEAPLVLAGGTAAALVTLLPTSRLLPELILDGLRLLQPRI